MLPRVRNLEAPPRKRAIQQYDLEKTQMADYGLNNSLKKGTVNLMTTYSVESQYAKLIAYEKSLRGSHPMLNRCL